jgi:hypothetical protein
MALAPVLKNELRAFDSLTLSEIMNSIGHLLLVWLAKMYFHYCLSHLASLYFLFRGLLKPIRKCVLVSFLYSLLRLGRGLRGQVVKTSVSYHKTSHLQPASVQILLPPM